VWNDGGRVHWKNALLETIEAEDREYPAGDDGAKFIIRIPKQLHPQIFRKAVSHCV